MSNIKYITNNIAVDLDKSRCVWVDGEADERVELWVGMEPKFKVEYVWLETNGAIYADQESLVTELVERGVPRVYAESAAEGDLGWFEVDQDDDE